MEKKATDRTCLKLYDKIDFYPKSCLPIRYPPKLSSTATSFHDLISANMTELIPNIDMGIHEEYDLDEIETWIQNTKCYMNEINENMQRKCDTQTLKLHMIKHQEIKSRTFDIQMVTDLPDDIIRCIHTFLLPETRIQMLLEKYPMYMNHLKKITCVNLKKYLACVQKKYVRTALSYNSKFPNRHTCIEEYGGFNGSFTKKEIGIQQLSKIFDALRNAVPKKPIFHLYFQKKALRFLQSLIYVGEYRINDLRHN